MKISKDNRDEASSSLREFDIRMAHKYFVLHSGSNDMKFERAGFEFPREKLILGKSARKSVERTKGLRQRPVRESRQLRESDSADSVEKRERFIERWCNDGGVRVIPELTNYECLRMLTNAYECLRMLTKEK